MFVLWILLGVYVAISVCLLVLLIRMNARFVRARARFNAKEAKMDEEREFLNRRHEEMTTELFELREEMASETARLQNELASETARLEGELASLSDALNAEQCERAQVEHVLSLVKEAHCRQNGRTALLVHDRMNTPKETVEVACDPALLDILTEQGKITALQSVKATDDFGTRHLNERAFVISESVSQSAEVYVATEVTDALKIPVLTETCETLRRMAAQGDTYTAAMSFDAFVAEAATGETATGMLLLVKTEASALADGTTEREREAYLKACATLLVKVVSDGLVGRYEADTFACYLPHATPEDIGTTADAILAGLQALHMTHIPGDAAASRAVIESTTAAGEGLADRIFCMSIRAAETLRDGLSGHHAFDVSTVGELLSRKVEIERVIAERMIRFAYRPVAQSADAKLFGYELIPCFTNPVYAETEQVAAEAALFGLSQALEELLCSEGMRAFAKVFTDGRLLYATRVWLRTFSGVYMTQAGERHFHEDHYDVLKFLILELPERADACDILRIKQARAARWGAEYAITCTSDVEDSLQRLLMLHPTWVTLSAEVLGSRAARPLLKELTARRRKDGLQIRVTDISNTDELEAAIDIGADYLSGDYIAAAGELGEINDRCMDRIAQIRFGKRG